MILSVAPSKALTFTPGIAFSARRAKASRKASRDPGAASAGAHAAKVTAQISAKIDRITQHPQTQVSLMRTNRDHRRLSMAKLSAAFEGGVTPNAPTLWPMKHLTVNAD